jgi:fatty acid desaturase
MWIFGISIFRSRQARRKGADYVGAASVRFMVPVMLVALVVLTANIAFLGAAWPYVVGVLALITTGFDAFVKLLLGTRWSGDLADD